jgi:hypothetical protein
VLQCRDAVTGAEKDDGGGQCALGLVELVFGAAPPAPVAALHRVLAGLETPERFVNRHGVTLLIDVDDQLRGHRRLGVAVRPSEACMAGTIERASDTFSTLLVVVLGWRR